MSNVCEPPEMSEREKELLITYFRNRIEQLKQSISAFINDIPEEKREESLRQVKGRIKENERYLRRVKQGRFWGTVVDQKYQDEESEVADR